MLPLCMLQSNVDAVSLLNVRDVLFSPIARVETFCGLSVLGVLLLRVKRSERRKRGEEEGEEHGLEPNTNIRHKVIAA